MNGDNDASGTGNIAAPVFGTLANFFGNSPSGDGETLSQDMYNEIARASAAAAEAAFGATNQVTPQPLSRAPNPALTPLPPVTPIVNTSLSELRAARAAESGGGITSSKGASKSSKDDDDKTTTELVTEAISKGLKQERTLRAKVMANKESTLWWLLKQIKALLIKFGISDLTKWQITTILLGTYFLWPKLKPSMRLLLHRVHLQVLSARDSLMSKVAAHIIGLTTTGVTFAIASRTNTNTDEDPLSRVLLPQAHPRLRSQAGPRHRCPQSLSRQRRVALQCSTWKPALTRTTRVCHLSRSRRPRPTSPRRTLRRARVQPSLSGSQTSSPLRAAVLRCKTLNLFKFNLKYLYLPIP